MAEIAALFGVSSRGLCGKAHSSGETMRIRRIAMYVAYVVLGIGMEEVGRAFDRDRTTVLRACHIVEDLRADLDFDRRVAIAERVMAAAFGQRVRGCGPAGRRRGGRQYPQAEM
jgi:hypothetical protein